MGSTNSSARKRLSRRSPILFSLDSRFRNCFGFATTSRPITLAFEKFSFRRITCDINLTGEYVCDVSDASGTALFDVVRRQWSTSLADQLGIARNILPDVMEISADQRRGFPRGGSKHGFARRHAGRCRSGRPGGKRRWEWNRRDGNHVVHHRNFRSGVRAHTIAGVRSCGDASIPSVTPCRVHGM